MSQPDLHYHHIGTFDTDEPSSANKITEIVVNYGNIEDDKKRHNMLVKALFGFIAQYIYLRFPETLNYEPYNKIKHFYGKGFVNQLKYIHDTSNNIFNNMVEKNRNNYIHLEYGKFSISFAFYKEKY